MSGGACSWYAALWADGVGGRRIGHGRAGSDLAAVLRELLREDVEVHAVAAALVDDAEDALLVFHRVAAELGLAPHQLLAHPLGHVHLVGLEQVGRRRGVRVDGDAAGLDGLLEHEPATATRVERGVQHRERLLPDDVHRVGALRGLVGAAGFDELVLDRAAPRLVRVREHRVLVEDGVLRQSVRAGGLVLDAAVRRRAVLVGGRHQHDDLDRVGGHALRGRAAVVVAVAPRTDARRGAVELELDPPGLRVTARLRERLLAPGAGTGRARGHRRTTRADRDRCRDHRDRHAEHPTTSCHSSPPECDQTGSGSPIRSYTRATVPPMNASRVSGSSPSSARP